MSTGTRPRRRKTTRTGTQRAAVYARISDARGDDTAGVERQVEDCLALAESRGFEVVDRYIDNNRSAYSGARRPEYERLLADVEAGRVDVIVVWASDRLYRRLADLEQLVEELQGVEVATCHSGEVNLDSADGRLHARMLGTVAQHSSEKSAERVARAAEQRARAGKFSGGKRRFGYSADGSELVEDEAEALRWAYSYVIDGGTMGGVVREFEARGLRGPLGARLTHPAVRDYLLRPMNAGVAVYQGVEVGTTDLPRIVDEDTWRTARAILTDPARRSTRGRPPKTLLGGLLVCTVCEGKLYGGTRTRTADDRDPAYLCRAGHVSRLRSLVDGFVSTAVLHYLDNNRDALGASIADYRSGTDGGAARTAEALRAERQALEDAFARGDLDVAAYAHGIKANNARREALDAAAVEEAPTGRTVGRLVSAPDVRAAWDAADMDTRRAIVREVVAEVRIGPNGTPGAFDPDSIAVVWQGAA
jgi:DNA invertase Pin-like site-specific DNA recombinase